MRDSQSGVIGGVVSEPGTYAMTVQARNEHGEDSLTLSLSVEPSSPFNAPLDNDSLFWFSENTWQTTQEGRDGDDALVSETLSGFESSGIVTQIQGPELLSFWWKRSSSNINFSAGLLEESQFVAIRENDNWERATLFVPSGLYTVVWTAWTSDAEGRVWLDQVETLGYANWLEEFGMTEQLRPNDDLDQDGLPNLLEFALESDPTQPEALIETHFPGQSIEFSLPDGRGLDLFTLTLEKSSTLSPGSWVEVEGSQRQEDGRVIFGSDWVAPGPGEALFYRFRIR